MTPETLMPLFFHSLPPPKKKKVIESYQYRRHFTYSTELCISFHSLQHFPFFFFPPCSLIPGSGFQPFKPWHIITDE